jgi:hypothetical protein
VTALFADIKGSTELMEDLDPEEARAIIDPALKLMIDAVHRYDGYIVQSTGDGVFALFGAPVAHEDHPQRALYAALRMQDELRRYSAKLVAEGGTPVEARIGATTGEVVVRSLQTGGGHTEYTPIGHTATWPRGCRRWHRPGRSRLVGRRGAWLKDTSSSRGSGRRESKACRSRSRCMRSLDSGRYAPDCNAPWVVD